MNRRNFISGILQAGTDLAAVEVALRHLEMQRHRERTLTMFVEWFFVLRILKELEATFSKNGCRPKSEVRHRALLSGMMGFGDILLSETASIDPSEVKRTGYTREALESNVRYLREKYEQWFVALDTKTSDRVWAKLMDERPASPGQRL